MGFYGDFMGFYGDLMGFYAGFMVILWGNGDFVVIQWDLWLFNGAIKVV